MGVEPVNISPALATVINRAGDRSDVDFDYLVQTAVRESSLNPQARAQTSSAVGLFQFIESTWLEVLKQEGPRLGYGQYADAIERNGDGNFVINDSGLRAQILALREDPQMSADLAAAFTKSNGEQLAERFGRHPSPGELYIAHFMGARGAEKLFEAGLEDPNQIAAEIFPRQARANPSIFYDSNGPRTVRGVYQSLISQHGQSGTTEAQTQTQTQMPVATANTSPLVAPSTTTHIPSRYGPPIDPEARQLSFDTLFSTPAQTVQASPAGAANPSGTGQSNSVVIDPGAAFFTQLYNQ